MRRLILFPIYLLLFTFKVDAGPFEVFVETPVESIEGSHLLEKSIKFDRLTTRGASDRDVLYFSDGQWMPAPLPGLTFRGTWDPEVNRNPRIDFFGHSYIKDNVTIQAVVGDYFVAENSLIDFSWSKGDWIVFNGDRWERINNTGAILSIFGRKKNVTPMEGDYNWAQIDKTESSIFDLSNVLKPETSIANYEGLILKWNAQNQQWRLEIDDVGVIQGQATSDQIFNGEIKDADISENAAIDVEKIANVKTNSGKLPFLGGNIKNLTIIRNDLIQDALGNLIIGPEGKVVLRAQGELIEFKFSELKELFDEVSLSIRNKEDDITPESSETMYFSQDRTWREFNLDFANEGEIYKFQTDENVWNAVLDDYDSSLVEAASRVTNVDTIKSSIEKLEAQLQQTNVDVVVQTPMIEDGSIEPTVHFKKPTESGFLLHSGSTTNPWEIKMTSGIQFKGEIDFSEVSSLPVSSVSGDYYVLTSSGDDNGTFWNKGDWAIYDGASFLQINNSGKVLSFNGRTGDIVSCPGNDGCGEDVDYNWSMLDKTNSKVGDFSDVTSPELNTDVNKVLKRVGGVWVVQDEDTGVSGNEGVPISSIADESVENRHLVNINAEQVASHLGEKSLSDDMTNLFDRSTGEMLGSIDLSSNDIENISTINYAGSEGLNLADAINFAVNKDSTIALKQDLISNGGTSLDILVSKDSGLGVETLDTSVVEEGTSNRYFSEDLARTSLGFPTMESATAPNEDINFGGVTPDTLNTAIEKIYARINAETNPQANSIEGDFIQGASILKSSLENANEIGQTIMYVGGQWNYRSIAGLSLKGEIDLGSTPISSVGLQDGDYYVVSGAGSIDSEDYLPGDWAVYYYKSETDNGFTRISKSQGIQSFNGRIGDISTCPDAINCPGVYDYNWEKINKENSTLSSFSSNVINYLDVTLGYTASDTGKILKWNAGQSRWEPGEDLKGLDISSISNSNFSNTSPKSITNSDIATNSISFSDISGLDTTFVNLKPVGSTPVEFSKELKITGEKSLSNINQVLDSTGTPLFNFNDIQSACSNFDPSNYETFSGEEAATTKLLNANRSFVKLKEGSWTGDESNVFYAPEKVRNIALTGYSLATTDYSILKVGETSFIEVFNKLAGKVKAFVDKTAGTRWSTPEEGSFIEVDNGDNGKMVFAQNTDIKIMNVDTSRVSPGFEVTIKRIDPVDIDSRNIMVDIELESGGQIEGKNKIVLGENHASITLKLIQKGTEAPEFVILRTSGLVN